MNRCDKFLKALRENGHAAALIHRPENIRYLTGFTGEGCAFVCEKAFVVVTDFRYVEQASRQAPECDCVKTVRGYSESAAVKDLCDKYGVAKLAIETDFLTCDSYFELKKTLENVELEPLHELTQTLREYKDAGEFDSMRKAGAIACKAFENILSRIHPGMTEKQVQIMLDYEMLSLGSEGNAFDTIAAAGVNGSLPHAIPSDYIIQKGDLLTLDFGARVDGYCSDMTRTVGFGKINDTLRAIYDTVLEAQLTAGAAVKLGAVCGDIDKIARDIIDARYLGAFGHSLGHGVGLFIHEQPRVGQGSTTILKPGHVVTVEPGVYIPGVGGCRIEDTMILTEEGAESVITSPKQLIEL